MEIKTPNKTSNTKKDWFISYNPTDIKIYGETTTAIVESNMLYFVIINGNHFHELSKLDTLEECFEYAKSKTLNKLSDKLDIEVFKSKIASCSNGAA